MIRTGGPLLTFAGGIASYTKSLSTITDPHPGVLDVVLWAVSGNDRTALLAAIGTGFAFVASVYQLFGPKPYTGVEGQADRKHQDKSFAAADQQQQARHDQVLARLEAMEQRLTADPAVAETSARSFAETVGELAETGDATDLTIAEQAVSGDPLAAGDALMAQMREDRVRGAERARQAARIYAPFSPAKAMAAYKEATDLDPADFWSWIELGRLRVQYETLASARACFQIALQQVTDERDRMVVHGEFGKLLSDEGHLREARQEFEAALAIAERLAAAEPGNALWQRDLSISYERLGEVEVAAGDLAAARQRFEAGLAIAERLAAAEPGNAGWQRDLWVSSNKFGEVEVAAGDLAAARQRFEAALAIAERLAAAEPGNAGWQRDLSISFNKLGDVEVAAGDLAAARARFEAGLAIAERLAAAEPGNAGWQRDLSVSYTRLGDVEVAAGDHAAARQRFEASLAIRERLVEQWPDHPQFAKDLAYVRARIAALE